MPSFDYRCSKCEYEFEKFYSFEEYDRDKTPSCPKCKGHTKKIVYTPAVIFKTSGFYATDNRKIEDEE